MAKKIIKKIVEKVVKKKIVIKEKKVDVKPVVIVKEKKIEKKEEIKKVVKPYDIHLGRKIDGITIIRIITKTINSKKCIGVMDQHGVSFLFSEEYFNLQVK